MLMHYRHTGTESFAVSLPDNLFFSVGSTPVYSGIKIDSDGNLYELTPTGTYSRFGTWLSIGTAANYYVSRTVIDGSLNIDAGAGPLQLNADREYSIVVSAGFHIATVRIDIASDVSGSPIVASNTYQFEAEAKDEFVSPRSPTWTREP